MSGLSSFLLSLFVAFPLVIGLVRYKKINEKYRPFLGYIVLSFFTEIINYFLIHVYHNNIVFLNFFSLAECLIFLLQFHRWGFIKVKRNFYLLLAITTSCWVAENFIVSEIYIYNRIFLIGYSFILVLLSIREINRAMILSTQSLYDNARFFICIGVIIYFTFNFISSTFRYYSNDFSRVFSQYLISIAVYANALTNIIYAFGMYYIPGKVNTARMFTEKE